MKVLLVDDDEDIRRIGQLSLQTVGEFDSLIATSAISALELAAEHRPDVILMDVMMPEMDGLSALEKILDSPDLCSIPVVFMTAKVQRRELDQYLEAGAAGVIQKPFDPMTLPREVQKILARQ